MLDNTSDRSQISPPPVQHTDFSAEIAVQYCLSKQVEDKVYSSKDNVSHKELFELESKLLNVFFVLKWSNMKLHYEIKTKFKIISDKNERGSSMLRNAIVFLSD